MLWVVMYHCDKMTLFRIHSLVAPRNVALQGWHQIWTDLHTGALLFRSISTATDERQVVLCSNNLAHLRESSVFQAETLVFDDLSLEPDFQICGGAFFL